MLTPPEEISPRLHGLLKPNFSGNGQAGFMGKVDGIKIKLFSRQFEIWSAGLHPWKLTAGYLDTQNDGLEHLLLNMAMFGIYVKFLGLNF